MILVIATSVELSSPPDIFNGSDGVVETLILVLRLAVIVSELESEVLSAAECTRAGVNGDMEILRFEDGVVSVGDEECGGSFILSSAVTGVFDEKLTGARPTAVDMEI